LLKVTGPNWSSTLGPASDSAGSGAGLEVVADWRELSILWRGLSSSAPDSAHLPGMKHKTANIDIRVEPELVEKIDAWRAWQRVPPSRSAAIV